MECWLIASQQDGCVTAMGDAKTINPMEELRSAMKKTENLNHETETAVAVSVAHLDTVDTITTAVADASLQAQPQPQQPQNFVFALDEDFWTYDMCAEAPVAMMLVVLESVLQSSAGRTPVRTY